MLLVWALYEQIAYQWLTLEAIVPRAPMQWMKYSSSLIQSSVFEFECIWHLHTCGEPTKSPVLLLFVVARWCLRVCDPVGALAVNLPATRTSPPLSGRYRWWFSLFCCLLWKMVDLAYSFKYGCHQAEISAQYAFYNHVLWYTISYTVNFFLGHHWLKWASHQCN